MNNQDQPSAIVDHNLDNIEVNSFHKHEPKSLLQENKFIKKQNEVLRRQLEKLSSRLDGEIRKRIDDSKKKQVNKGEQISQMELQNAYKKCQIYKKQAQMYRKRLESVGDEGRMEDFERRISSYARDNQELKEQIKQLKKISKLQQKGLAELGIEGYTKLVGQNQKLKEQVRILKKQVDNYRRILEGSKHKKTHTSQFDDRINESADENRRTSSKRGDSRIESKIKRKLRTQPQTGSSNQQINDLLQQKVQKDYMKIKSLATQKNKLREIVDNLKFQLSQKEKETTMLKDKISQLRKNNHLLQSQVISNRPQQGSAEKRIKKDRQSASNYPKGIRSKNQSRQKQQQTESKRKPWKPQHQPINHESKQFVQEQMNHIPPSQESKQSSYPRSEAIQNLNNNSLIKWSHQHLSSKIREMQILSHEDGHIKDIHVRYDKGEPKKYDRSTQRQRYEIFTCCEDQYIKYVEGAFFDNYLQYIMITSNHRRVQKYGNYTQYQQNKEAEHFEFEVKQGEYPGGLFGQSDEIGVRKLGCFIHKES